ncbi:MAG TPA: PDZ domain-containing protein, partial [Quisquiliibacterium sp.]|nr:PDZ domain-containing protein [Quisquiliibacterium sp.]
GTKPGSKVPVQVWRKGANRELQVTVAEMEPERNQRASRSPGQPGGGQAAPAAANAFGLVVSEIPEERRAQLRIRGGVIVDSAEGAAARAGLRAGDVLLSLDNQDITGVKQFNDLVAKADKAKAHVLLVRRGDNASFVPIRPGAMSR